jgi:hypothetical protein
MPKPTRSRKRMERIGRECVRSVQSNDTYVLVIGSLPRKGFPRGSKIRNRKDGQLERLYEAEALLAAIQKYMANFSEGESHA